MVVAGLIETRTALYTMEAQATYLLTNSLSRICLPSLEKSPLGEKVDPVSTKPQFY